MQFWVVFGWRKFGVRLLLSPQTQCEAPINEGRRRKKEEEICIPHVSATPNLEEEGPLDEDGGRDRDEIAA